MDEEQNSKECLSVQNKPSNGTKHEGGDDGDNIEGSEGLLFDLDDALQDELCRLWDMSMNGVSITLYW